LLKSKTSLLENKPILSSICTCNKIYFNLDWLHT